MELWSGLEGFGLVLGFGRGEWQDLSGLKNLCVVDYC